MSRRRATSRTVTRIVGIAALGIASTAACEVVPDSVPADSRGDSLPSTSPATPMPSQDAAITQRGLGTFEVVETSISELETGLGRMLDLMPQTEHCSLAIAEEIGVAAVMTGEGTTMAFVVSDPTLRTADGIGVGSTYNEVIAAYGDLVFELGDTSQTGGPIVLVDDLARPGADFDEHSRLMAFDTDLEGTVTRVRVGMWPWVAYIDYCSDQAHRSEETGWPLA